MFFCYNYFKPKEEYLAENLRENVLIKYLSHGIGIHLTAQRKKKIRHKLC